MYAQTLSFGLTNLDDSALVVKGYQFNRDISNIGQAFQRDVFHQPKGGMQYYRPLLTVSFMMDAQWGGEILASYHLSNILIHLAACFLLLWMLTLLGQGPARAFFFTALFAVHPVLTQAVAWIPGRNDSLLALFTVGSLGSLVLYFRDRRWFWALLHLLMMAGALFAKETAIVLPLVCASYFLLYTSEKLLSRRILSLAAGWIGILTLWYIVRQSGIGGSSFKDLAFNHPGVIFKGFISYFGKIVFPINLTIAPDIRDIKPAYGIAAVLAFMIMSITGIKNRKRFVFGGIWFILFIIPTVVYNSEMNAFMDHRLYLPLIGFGLMLTELKLWDSIGRSKIIGSAVLIILLIVFALGTMSYGRVFRDDLACWQQAVILSPNSAMAHNSLGVSYSKRDEWAKAEQQYLQALILSPNFYRAMFNLGSLYMLKGPLDKAEAMLKNTVSLCADFPSANYNLGQVCERQGKSAEAEGYYRKEISLDPRSIKSYVSLGALYQERGDFRKAMAEYDRALKLRPDNADIHTNLGVIYQRQGNAALAEGEYLKALNINPRMAQAHYNLAVLYKMQGRLSQSRAEYQRALECTPYSGESRSQ